MPIRIKYFKTLNFPINSNSSKLSFTGMHSFNKLNFFFGLEDDDLSGLDKFFIKNSGANLNYEKNWNERFKTNVMASFSNYYLDYFGNEIANSFFDSSISKKNKIEEINLSLDANYNLNKNSNINFGYDFISDDLSYTIEKISELSSNEDFTLSGENTSNNNTVHEIYGQYQYSNEKWFINSGLRTSYVSALNEVFYQPNINVRYTINDNLSLQLSTKLKNQFVSQIVEFQTENFGLDNKVWVASNGTNIPVLQSKQLSVSSSFKKNNWTIDVEAFINQSKGLTSLTNGFERNGNIISNGKSNSEGLEILIRKSYNRFSTLIGYTLMNNELTFDNINNNMPFSSDFDIRHYLNVVQNMTLNDFELSAGWRYKSPSPFTPVNGLILDNPDAINIDYAQELNSGRLNHYTRFDISSTYNFKPFKNKSIKAKITASLLNVFNKPNQISRDYSVIFNAEDTSYDVRENNTISILRTPNLMFKLNF